MNPRIFAIATKIYQQLPGWLKYFIFTNFRKLRGTLGDTANEAVSLGFIVSKLIPKLGRFDLVIHVGAHRGEEAGLYERIGATTIVWVEADPFFVGRLQLLAKKRSKADHRVVHCIASSTDGIEKTLYVYTNDGASNSVYKPTDNLNESFPSIQMTSRSLSVRTMTLPSIIEELKIDIDKNTQSLLVVDVQGHELDVLLGCDEKFLKKFNLIQCEISEIELYEGGSKPNAVYAFFEALGHIPISPLPRFHGDVLFQSKT